MSPRGPHMGLVSAAQTETLFADIPFVSFVPFLDSFPLSPLLAAPGISFEMNSLFPNPCLGVCYWGNLSLNLQILIQRAASHTHSSTPSFPSLITYHNGHSMLVCLGFQCRVHTRSTSAEFYISFSKQL